MEVVRMNNEQVFQHCYRVGVGASFLAKAAGLSENDQLIAEFSGLLHDIGKVGIPDSILMKPSKLTDEEYSIMKTHSEKSVEILKPFAEEQFFKVLIPIILSHHERFDGRGYPHGVKGEDIPLISRLLAIVDTYDAMANCRPYRKGLSDEVIYQELRTFSGIQFDPKLVQIFTEAHRFQKRMDEPRAFLEVFSRAA